MANFRENLASAYRAIRENWLRSGLTMLGIIIGVGSVVLLISIGQGVKEDVTRQIDSLGTNVVFILPGKLDGNGQPNAMATLGISTLTERDVRDMQGLPGITAATPIMFVAGTIDAGKASVGALVLGATAAIQEIRPTPLEEGRFFRRDEEDRPVCVLAHDPKERLFGKRPAIGATVRILKVAYRVIGVMKPEEESLFNPGSFANFVYVPYGAARRLHGSGQINRIFLRTDYRRPPGPTKTAITRTLLRNHDGRDDFGVLTPGQLLGAIYRVFNIITALVVGIGAISLVVAGIGIMNIMLVTVTERTREIGIRKTVGARQSDIFLQFLIEAVSLSFVGGIAGTLIAAVICAAVKAWSPLKPLITPGAIAIAFGVCFLVGVVFGVAPALRAARQDPIQALRWE